MARERRAGRLASIAAALVLVTAPAGAAVERLRLAPGASGWLDAGLGAVRGLTVGPIESRLHPGRGYGTPHCARSLAEARALGATWVSLTPFGRVWDVRSSGVDPTFEAPYEENRRAVARAVAQAHALGLRALIVPHLWLEHARPGEWRALIDPGSDEGWERWMASYRAFLLGWAEVARDAGAEMLSVGVELRSWVTTARAPRFVELIREVRASYPGLLTYAANWDDAESSVILGALDVIGINAFYPLAETPGAGMPVLLEGGRRVARRVRSLAEAWGRPVLFTEMGYTTRPDPAVRPWEWPDEMKGVVVDQHAQASAYFALLAPLADEPHFAGFFVWRLYADPDDMSQEPEWGFSPRAKLAELVVRDAFAARWAADGAATPGDALWRHRAERYGLY